MADPTGLRLEHVFWGASCNKPESSIWGTDKGPQLETVRQSCAFPKIGV